MGLEGGQLTVSRCRIQKCKQHGLALFNSLEGLEGTRHLPSSVQCDFRCMHASRVSIVHFSLHSAALLLVRMIIPFGALEGFIIVPCLPKRNSLSTWQAAPV